MSWDLIASAWVEPARRDWNQSLGSGAKEA